MSSPAPVNSMLEFTKQQRLLRRSEFTETMDRGVKVVMPQVVLLGRHNGSSASRIGFIVSKKVGGAVQRNKVKRRLRELYRTFPNQPVGMDIVAIARHGASRCEFLDLGRSLQEGLVLLERRAKKS